MTRVLHELDIDAACHVIANMRAIDHEEIFAIRDNGSEELLLADVIEASQAEKGQVFTYFTDEDVPVSLMGWHEIVDGVANVWCFGTDDWHSAILTMTRIVRRVIVPTLISTGIHRGECRALASREDTAKWLPMLGLMPEAVLAGFGRQREDFILYAWEPGNVLRKR